MSAFVRALLWIAFIVVPGGVFLLPLLVGDAMARRKKAEPTPVVAKVEPAAVHALAAPAPVSTRAA